jgi:hypothetical protein
MRATPGDFAVAAGLFIRGATAAVQSNPHPAYERRRVAVVAAVTGLVAAANRGAGETRW